MDKAQEGFCNRTQDDQFPQTAGARTASIEDSKGVKIWRIRSRDLPETNQEAYQSHARAGRAQVKAPERESSIKASTVPGARLWTSTGRLEAEMQATRKRHSPQHERLGVVDLTGPGTRVGR